MRINIILPLTILILLTGCGAVKTDDKVETKQPHENSESEHKLYDKTFETELVKDDGLVQIRVHNELEKDYNNHYTGLYTYIDIIKDDKIIDTIDTDIYMKCVTDMSFFDFNCDGKKDIVITGDASKFLLCKATSDYNYYVSDAGNIMDNIAKQRGNDFSMDKLKSVLLGDNLSCDYSDYRKAYSQMARLFKLEAYESDNEDNSFLAPSYALVDIDGNSPMELVAKLGCTVWLYDYKNGCVNELPCDNQECEYSPGNGIIRWNMWRWEGDGYDTYYKLLHYESNECDHIYHDEYGYECDYKCSTIPWDKEQEQKQNYTYYNYTDQNMSDDELKKLVDGYSNLDYEVLDGSLGYDEFKKMLEEDAGIENRNYTTDLYSDFGVSEKKQEASEVDYNLYDEIINGIKTNMKKESLWSFAANMGLAEEMYGSSFENSGYLQEDIDGDGVDELILGCVNSTTSERNQDACSNYGDYIFDLFTIRNGKVLHVLSGGYRNRYYLCEGGIIEKEGSGSCYDGYNMVYRYSKGELKLIEGSEWSFGTRTCYRNKKVYEIADPDANYAEEYYKKYRLKQIDYIPFVAE